VSFRELKLLTFVTN